MATDAPVAAAPVAPAVAAATPAAPKPATKPSALWVGDLNPEVDEALLYQIFGGNQTPSVVSNIRVCRNHQTRESLGYGYVNFANPVDAEAALQRLNYQPINGRVCRIAWSQRDPTVRRSNVGNIFVKNLGPEIDTKQLHDTFKEFGQILSCKVATDKNGISKGYGFVHFEAEGAAKLAIETVNGLPFNGRNVEVMPYLPRQLRSGPEWNNLYVKNLPKGFMKKDLEDLFSPYGDIFSSLLATDGETGASKGYGFVCFKTHAAALAAVEKLNGKEMDGEPASVPPFKKAKKEGAEGAEEEEETPAPVAPTTDRKLVLFVGRALKKAERERAARERDEQNRREKHAKWAGCNLYVRNLDETIDDERLRKEFAPHGTINSAVVAKDTEGRSKLFGYVCFSNAEEATKALQAMHHKMLVGKPLFVAPWQPKEARQAAMAQAQAARAANSRSVAATAGAAGQAALTPQMASVFSQLQSNPQVFAMMFYAVMMQQAQLMNGGANPSAFAAYQQLMRQGNFPRTNAANAAALLQQFAAAGAQQGAVAAPAGAAPQRAAGFLSAVQGGQAPMQGSGPRPGPARNTSGPKPTGPRPAPGATAPRPPVAGGARPAAPGAKSPSGRPGQPGPQAAYRSQARNVDEAAAAATMSMLAAAAAGMQGMPANASVPAAQPGMVLVPTSSLPGAQPAAPAVQDSATFASTLANASTLQRRQLIGEKLYAQIRPVVGERAGKITGMLLDGIDESELLHLLESPDELNSRITEALEVLRKAVAEGAPQ